MGKAESIVIEALIHSFKICLLSRKCNNDTLEVLKFITFW